MELSDWFKGFEKGKVYYLTFLECTCHLCKKGYVTTLIRPDNRRPRLG